MEKQFKVYQKVGQYEANNDGFHDVVLLAIKPTLKDAIAEVSSRHYYMTFFISGEDTKIRNGLWYVDDHNGKEVWSSSDARIYEWRKKHPKLGQDVYLTKRPQS